MRSIDPVCVIVENYQTSRQRFWNGRRMVTDASEAQQFERFSEARKEFDRLEAQRTARGSSAGAMCVVENYGLTSENVALGGNARRIAL